MQMVNLGIALADAATRGIGIAIEGRDLVRQLVAEDREPTAEEWAKITAVNEDLSAQIQGDA
jgi:hypothetical protein